MFVVPCRFMHLHIFLVQSYIDVLIFVAMDRQYLMNVVIRKKEHSPSQPISNIGFNAIIITSLTMSYYHGCEND